MIVRPFWGESFQIKGWESNIDALEGIKNDIFLKAGGTTFGSITNVSTHVVIKDGTTTAATLTATQFEESKNPQSFFSLTYVLF